MRKRFKHVLKIAMLVMLFAFTNVLYAQRNITGTIKDAKDGNVLPGVNIMVKGTTVGATTNMDGKFALKVPAGSNVIVVSFIGYETQEITLIDAKDDYEVLLAISSQELGEVVVTALGIKREQKAIGYAITEVKGEEIAKANTINPIGAIQGKAAGVSIGASDGGSFAAYKMSIRGVSTLKSSNQPIFVIDGVIVDNNVSGDSEWNGGTNDWGNELKNLNPDEFESVTILKGSAATALYGSRGIFGAVVITTKQAKKAEGLGISITQSFGMDKVYATPDLQNEYGPGILAGHNYYDPNPFTTEAFYTQDVNGETVHSLFWDDGLSFGPKFDNSPIYGYDHKMTTYKAYKDNMKDAFDTGYNTNTNVSIQGGNEKATFFVSQSLTKKTGYYPGNDFSRSSTLIKGTYKAGEKLLVDGSMSYTQSNPKNPISDMGEYFINGWFHRTYDTKYFKTKYTADHGGVPSSAYGDALADVPASSVWFSLNNNSVSRIENTILE